MSRAERVAARREYLKDVAEAIGDAGQYVLDTSVKKTEIRQEGKSERTEDRQEGKSERTEDKAAGGYYTPESTTARWEGISDLAAAGVEIGGLIATGGASGAIPDFSFGGSESDGSFGIDDVLAMIPDGSSDSGSSSSGTNATATQGGERRSSDSSSLGLLAALGAGFLALRG